MKFRKIGKIIFSIFLLSLFMFAFTACHGSLFNYRGATVDAENRIALLEGKLRQGQWHTIDLSLNYHYKRDANTLQLSGLVEFDNHLKNFTTLDYFSLWIQFIDEEGKVVGSRVIAVADYHKMIENISFEHNLELPLDITAIAFSYDGRVSEGGRGGFETDSGGTSWDFWKVPHR